MLRKTRLLLVLLVVNFTSFAQDSVSYSYQPFKEVCDSIEGTICTREAFSFTTFEGSERFYFVLRDSTWICNAVINPNREISPYKNPNELYVFQADSIVKQLRDWKIDSLRQYSEEELEILLNEHLIPKRKRKKEAVTLMYASHDSKVSVTYFSPSKPKIEYRWALIIDERMHFIADMNYLYLIHCYLRKL